ncbi:MAG TPA: hypothetical protein EYO73_01820 [Sulfurimonas sp.]|nr:hypothetical protein [Sulfurimonas sp.]
MSLRGPRLDLVSFLDNADREELKYKRGPRLRVNLNVGRVEISPGKFLRSVYGELGNDGLVWSHVNLSTIIDDEKSLVIKLSPKNGKRNLYVASNDAGAVLRKLGLYQDIMGGKLALKAEFQGMGPDSKVVGKGVIEDFRLVDAPLLARLLGIASITGIPDELAGAGLSFQRFDVPFTKETGIVEVKDAKAGGFNLGITVSGTLDLESETLDIKGSIAPLDKVNSLFGSIPLFGVLFSGGEKGGGLFAAEYSMVGPIDDPEITTNPLTALTPGIFRKLFEILPGANSRGGTTDWPDPDDPN